MKKWDLARIGIVLAGIFLLYIIVIIRLFYWQVIRAEELKSVGKRQSSQTLEIPAIRGQILSSDNFPLATNTISYLLYINPKLVEDKHGTSLKLADMLSYDRASVSAALDRDLYWVKIAQNVSSEKKKEIEKLNIKGLGFQQEFSRFYPEASMSANLVGFLGRDAQGGNKGYFGVEGQYNEQLEGRNGALYAIRDALGNPILTDIREDQKIDGSNIKLTIDRTIQFSTDKRLKEGIEKYEAEGGSAIVMDSKTGAILSMSSFPNFDPQEYYEYNTESYTNPVLSNLYEPGSTFKVLVMAAALDMGMVRPDTKCNICAGPIQIGEYKIKTWNDKYYKDATMAEVLIHSDNTGMVFVGKKLGIDNMSRYFEKFGLGEPTGIDLQGETTGVIRDRDSWYPIDLATSSFGQGISITPMQLLTAVNSLANEGKLMRPYVVSEIVESDGGSVTIKPKVVRKTVSSAAAKTISSMMVRAVEEGESKWVKVENYKFAGKTGTAQIPVAGHYDPNQTVASFVGFFPPSDPKITMLVLVNKPKTSIYGSETAAPIFFNIARDIIKYYNLPSN